MDDSQDQEYFETYLEKLNEEEREEEDGELEGDVIHAIKHDMNTADCDNDQNDTIITQSDASFFIPASEENEDVKPAKLEGTRKADVTAKTTANKRKKVAQPVAAPSKRTKLETSTTKALKKEKIDPNPVNETITSEVGNTEEIYEFDENEQDPDDPGDVDDTSYEYKGVLKKTKKKSKADDAIYDCMICPFKASKKFLLSRHLKTHSTETPFKCSVCERGFKTNASLQNHRNTHLGLKPHACKNCDMAFTTSGELIRHERYKHTHYKPHKCNECDASFVELSKLRRHMRCHTGERPYQCPHCTYASPDMFKLKRHIRIHTGEKPYECDICHARFTQSNSLKHHRLIHSVNDKPVFQCNLCPTTCGRKTDLRHHIKKLHNSDQPIPCKRCGKELPDRYTYKMHIKTHEGEKCFRCDYCPYASISQRYLESHMLIHLGEKPFICEVCEAGFRQKCLLVRHMKIYHSNNYEAPEPRKKDHKCPHCNKLFAFNGNLMRHMETHDPASKRFEEKAILKMGRLKRLQADGSVVTVANKSALSKVLEGFKDDDYATDDPEEHKQEDDELLEEQYEEQEEEEEEEEDYNEQNIQYVYDELAEQEYEEQEETNEDYVYDDMQGEIIGDESRNYIHIKEEKILNSQPDFIKSLAVKHEDGNNDDEMEVHDNQGFIIEVLPDEDDEDNEQLLNEIQKEIQTIQKQPPPAPVEEKNIYKQVNKASVIKSNKKSQSLISDYFGFEVDADEEDDAETKGAIKLLQMIEQE